MAVEKFPVEAGHIMMFARAVGDTNKIYHDAAYARNTEPGTVIAPPTFVQASAQFNPDYHLRPMPASRGSAPAGSPPVWRARKAAEAVAVCTPSSTTSITAIPGPATY